MNATNIKAARRIAIAAVPAAQQRQGRAVQGPAAGSVVPFSSSLMRPAVER